MFFGECEKDVGFGDSGSHPCSIRPQRNIGFHPDYTQDTNQLDSPEKRTNFRGFLKLEVKTKTIFKKI